MDLRSFLLLLLGFLLITNIVYSEEKSPQIDQIEIRDSGREISISFFASERINPEIFDVLRSGIPVKVEYEIVIGEQGLIRDRIILHDGISYNIYYDNLRDEVRLIKFSEEIKSFSLKSISEIVKIVFNEQEYRVKKEDFKGIKGKYYFLRIRNNIERLDSIKPFGLTLPFQNKKKHGMWYETGFIY